MAKTTKTTHLTNDIPVLTKKTNFKDFLEESLPDNPGKFEWRARLINSMMLFAEKETSLTLMQFCKEYRLNYWTLDEWAEKYTDIGKAWKYLKKCLSDNRHVGNMRRVLSESVYKDIHELDSDWLKVNEYNDNRTKKVASEPTVFNVNFDKPPVIPKPSNENAPTCAQATVDTLDGSKADV